MPRVRRLPNPDWSVGVARFCDHVFHVVNASLQVVEVRGIEVVGHVSRVSSEVIADIKRKQMKYTRMNHIKNGHCTNWWKVVAVIFAPALSTTLTRKHNTLLKIFWRIMAESCWKLTAAWCSIRRSRVSSARCRVRRCGYRSSSWTGEWLSRTRRNLDQLAQEQFSVAAFLA